MQKGAERAHRDHSCRAISPAGYAGAVSWFLQDFIFTVPWESCPALAICPVSPVWTVLASWGLSIPPPLVTTPPSLRLFPALSLVGSLAGL